MDLDISEHFKNPVDENDTYDKHIDICKSNCFSDNLNEYSEKEKFVGDHDEIILCS